MKDVRKQKYEAPRRRFPAGAYVILAAVQERSLGYARDDYAREALSKFRGASDIYAPHYHFAFLISNFSFKRNFQTQSKGSTLRGLTLNLEL